MDISRPEHARKIRRRRWLYGSAMIGLLILATLGLSRLEQAVPVVESSSVWSDTVKRGDMVLAVRGSGTLVPNRIQFVQASSDGRIERILVLPGAKIQPETVLMELGNPELEQALFDSKWQLEAAEAELRRLEIQLESERLTKESEVESLHADWKYAELEAQANEQLAAEGLVAELEARRLRLHADDLKAKHENLLRQLKIAKEAAEAQITVQGANLKKLQALVRMNDQKVKNLRVRAGVSGVLQEIGDQKPLQVGQRVSPGTTLAKIVQPTDLKAEIKIAETQVKDVQIGQRAKVDTRNGIIPGRVARVDPAVQNGTVAVDIELEGGLPKGARPDLSVDGTIELELIKDVLYVGRPVHGRSESTASVFTMINGGNYAVRVPVRFGRSSVSLIEVEEGVEAGDEIILSDMSRWDSYDRLRLK